jgi:hypothetical protein
MPDQNDDAQTESVEKHFIRDSSGLVEEPLPKADDLDPEGNYAKISNFSIDNFRPNKNIKQNILLIEYKTLREELLKRMELRQHVVQINLTIASLILSYGLIQRIQNTSTGQMMASPEVALIYPPIAALLGLGWAQIENRIQVISEYIRVRIEKNIPDLCWETYMDEFRKGDLGFANSSSGTKKFSNDEELIKIHDKLGRFGSSILLSHGGVFIGTQIMALYIGFPWNPILIMSSLYWFLSNPKEYVNSMDISNIYYNLFFGGLVLFDCYCCVYIYKKFKNLERFRRDILRVQELDPSVPLRNP